VPLLITDLGELLAGCLTPATVEDRKPLPPLLHGRPGQGFGDRGSISPALFPDLLAHRGQLLTQRRKDLKTKLMPLLDKVVLRKRALLAPLNAQLQHRSQLDHARPRRVTHFWVNLVAGLIASPSQPQKPSLPIRIPHEEPLTLVTL